jgi:hypothetical protein
MSDHPKQMSFLHQHGVIVHHIKACKPISPNRFHVTPAPRPKYLLLLPKLESSE